MVLKVLAPAKINLALEVFQKVKNSSYHNVDMIMQSVGLSDVVELSVCETEEILIKSDEDLNCTAENNICYKVAKKFFDYTGIKNRGIKINIKKSIPISAGLAGGSSDGAAVLVGMNKIFKTGLSETELCKIGGEIGADIPFCIVGGTARAKGIGTEIYKIESKASFYVVIVKPNISVSTALAYEKIDKIKNEKFFDVGNLEVGLKSGDIEVISKNLFNRFEKVADEEETEKIKKLLKENGSISSLMSGSGPSVYGIFNNKSKAEACFENIKKIYPKTFLCSFISHGTKIL